MGCPVFPNWVGAWNEYIIPYKIQYVIPNIPNTFTNKESFAQEDYLQLKNFISYLLNCWGVFFPSLPNIIIYWNQISTLAWDGISSAGIAICRQRKHAFLSKTNIWTQKAKASKAIKRNWQHHSIKTFWKKQLGDKLILCEWTNGTPFRKACHLWIEPQYIPWLHGVQKKYIKSMSMSILNILLLPNPA